MLTTVVNIKNTRTILYNSCTARKLSLQRRLRLHYKRAVPNCGFSQHLLKHIILVRFGKQNYHYQGPIIVIQRCGLLYTTSDKYIYFLSVMEEVVEPEDQYILTNRASP